MKNAVLAYKTLDHIKAHPKHWDQSVWHCGTTHCFAGLVELFTTGEDESTALTWDVAAEALGIDDIESRLLFNPENKLSDLVKQVEDIFGPDESQLYSTGALVAVM